MKYYLASLDDFDPYFDGPHDTIAEAKARWGTSFGINADVAIIEVIERLERKETISYGWKKP